MVCHFAGTSEHTSQLYRMETMMWEAKIAHLQEVERREKLEQEFLDWRSHHESVKAALRRQLLRAQAEAAHPAPAPGGPPAQRSVPPRDCGEEDEAEWLREVRSQMQRRIDALALAVEHEHRMRARAEQEADALRLANADLLAGRAGRGDVAKALVEGMLREHRRQVRGRRGPGAASARNSSEGPGLGISVPDYADGDTAQPAYRDTLPPMPPPRPAPCLPEPLCEGTCVSESAGLCRLAERLPPPPFPAPPSPLIPVLTRRSLVHIPSSALSSTPSSRPYRPPSRPPSRPHPLVPPLVHTPSPTLLHGLLPRSRQDRRAAAAGRRAEINC